MKKLLFFVIACSVSLYSLGIDIQRDLSLQNYNSEITKAKKGTEGQLKTNAKDQWIKLGTGVFTDIIISSIYNASAAAISVEFEQNAEDPTIYRIQNPYENWKDRRADGLIWYDESKATPMIIHVVDGKYAWFEEFNTGLYIDTADDYGPIVGEITIFQQAEELIAKNGITNVINNSQNALCAYKDGTMTLPANGTFRSATGTQSFTNIRIDVAGEPMFRGNKNGAFCVQLPDAKDLNPKMKWNTLEGKAKFTDGFTALFAYKDEPQYPVYEVEIQQNEADPNMYRLVNPFADFVDNYSSYEITYDDSKNYYMTIHTFPDLNLACTNTFFSGLIINGVDMFGVENQAYYFYDSYASTFNWYLSEVAEEFSEMFGEFKDGILTYPAYYQAEYSGQIMDFPTFTGWTGSYKDAYDNEQIYIVNKLGNFKVAFPGAEVEDKTEEPVIQQNVEPEYYNLQGIRIFSPQNGTVIIEKRGNKTIKKIFR